MGGTIESTILKAAEIHGNDENGSLTIYNATKGITFKNKFEDDSEEEVFSIGQEGL